MSLTRRSPAVGFCGLGLMGAPMAANLVRRGFYVRGWNRSASKTEPLRAIGGRPCATAAEAARDARCVITMLWDEQAVDEVLFGATGVVAGAAPGTVVIDMSTTTPEYARACARRLHAHGLLFLDAPVLGTLPRAEAGTLAIIAGGEAETLDQVRDILLGMGSTIHHLGPVGSGQLVKLSNNAIAFATAAALAEGMAMIAAGGVELGGALEALLHGSGRSDVMSFVGPMIAQGDMRASFLPTPSLVLKDLHAARATAVKARSRAPVTATLIGLYEEMVMAGRGELGFHAIYELLLAQPTPAALLSDGAPRERVN